MKMFTLRFSTFALLLVFTLLRDSSAYANKAMEKSLSAKKSEPQVEEDFVSNVKVIKEDDKPMIAKLGGRKLGVEKTLKTQNLKAKVVVTTAGQDEITGAATFIGTSSCDDHEQHKEKGTTFNEKSCKSSSKKRSSSSSSNSMKDKMVGLTAFSADYHGPKSHPPKHN